MTLKLVSSKPEGKLFQGHAGEMLGSLPMKSVDFIYVDPPFMTQKVQKGPKGSYSDVWTKKDWSDLMHTVVLAASSVLKDTGSIMVHVDERTSAEVRSLLNGEFGSEMMINEIIWCYQSGGAGKRSLAKKHDTIFWFAKTNNYKFNILREPYPRDYGNRKGFHPDGRMLNDWWQIPIMSTTSPERCGYPNQKPLQLLERCIKLSTDPNDLVVDVFCGSGTTAVAAKRLDRKFLVSDVSDEAVNHTLARIT